MNISSPAFLDGAAIPTNYSCEGSNVNPPLAFSDVPSEAASLVLFVEDWDSPASPYVHWVVYNIPPQATGIEEETLPEGAVSGTSTGNIKGYEGPCPPDMRHGYQFKLYALDISLDLPAFAERAAVLEAMDGHIMAEANLMGTYEKGVVASPKY
jgi:hypothetical protein